MKKAHIIISGSGINTKPLTELWEKNLGLSEISITDAFRELLVSGSPLCNEVKSYIDNGELVPATVSTQVLGNAIRKSDGDIQIVRYP
jgi:adenylate kinase family enzyme